MASKIELDRLEALVQMSGEVDGLTAGSPLEKSSCLGMARLERIANAGNGDAVREERWHVQACPRCRYRLAAFRELGGAEARQPSPQRFSSIRSGYSAALAASILLVIGFWPAPPVVEDARPADRHGQVASSAQSGADSGSVSIDYLPAGGEGVGRIDRFQLVAERNCSILAVLRTWGADCSCLGWNTDQSWTATLEEGDFLHIDVDVSDAPPVTQVLLVLSAGAPEHLPTDPDDARHLLQCLEDNVPSGQCDSDPTEYLAAIPSCFPAGIEVVSRPFVVGH